MCWHFLWPNNFSLEQNKCQNFLVFPQVFILTYKQQFQKRKMRPFCSSNEVLYVFSSQGPAVQFPRDAQKNGSHIQLELSVVLHLACFITK